MDIGLVAAVIMVIVWAIATFAYDAPGWVHLFLSVGMFLLIWRIAVLSSSARRPRDDASLPPGSAR